jgi:two-component system, response regulator PdtaR
MAAKVLVVEDEVLIAYHLQDLIEDAGYRVTAIASDPADALHAATAERPDFSLMDIRLAGGSSGLTAARLLYDSFAVRSLFVSANLDDLTRSQVAPLHPLGFIGKPFLAADVIAALHAAAREVCTCRSA